MKRNYKKTRSNNVGSLFAGLNFVYYFVIGTVEF